MRQEAVLQEPTRRRITGDPQELRASSSQKLHPRSCTRKEVNSPDNLKKLEADGRGTLPGVLNERLHDGPKVIRICKSIMEPNSHSCLGRAISFSLFQFKREAPRVSWDRRICFNQLTTLKIHLSKGDFQSVEMKTTPIYVFVF